MTITKAGICFLVALVLFSVAFLWDFVATPFPAGRISTLGFAFVAAGLLLTQ